ncbi:MAG: hypothetical protein FWC41_08045, partial [Firmicutes bacterium]|nr:hypothetical protein [Bacillota bacterium]
MATTLKKEFEKFKEKEKKEIPDYFCRELEEWELEYWGRTNRKFTQYLKDGISLNIRLTLSKGIPILEFGYPEDERIGYFAFYLTPEIENFIFNYLFIGDSRKPPKFSLNREDIEEWADENYIYRHLKRELERNAEFTFEEFEDGISITAHYPYGSIKYGILPHSIDELDLILENTESPAFLREEYDIQKLHSEDLPIIPIPITKEQTLTDIFTEGIPSNTILDKTKCGIGATYLEITFDHRHSIIIEPNVPVITGKKEEHPQIIGVYEKVTQEKIIEEITARAEERKEIKILTTPDSFPKVITALKKLKIPYRQDFFLLFDECDKIISDIDFREKMSLPIDEFFLFTNKAMVSATPIIIDDPRFKKQEFKVIKIIPDYDYSQALELKPTNNVSLMLKRTIEKINQEVKDVKYCIFLNYVQGISDMVHYLNIPLEEASIYCSDEKHKKLEKEGWKNVSDVLVYNADKTVNLPSKYNFFTSRFYSAVDIKLNCKPIVIMLSMAYKALPDETPFTLIDPATEAIQIFGRFRNGIKRLIHITDTNPDLEWWDKEEVKQFLQEQYAGYQKLIELESRLTTDGEKYIVNQAIDKTDFVQEGYIYGKDKINFFRWNNAYLDERLKMLYNFPTLLYKAYSQSGAFNVYSESEFCIYTEKEIKEVRNTNIEKAKRIKLLHEIFLKMQNPKGIYNPQEIEVLKNDFSLFFEAFKIIGFQKVKKLKFLDSAIKAEIKEHKLKEELIEEKVTNDVYSVFKAGEKYTVAFINSQLREIFTKHNISLGRRIQASDIQHYFKAVECRTSRERGWKLIRKLI